MAKKRGRGEFYDQVKDVQLNILLTKTAARMLKAKIAAYRDSDGKPVSVCEFFERFAREIL